MKARISALMDDELDTDGAEYLFKALNADGELAERWSTYHLIGDALRGETMLRSGFPQRLMTRLDAEPTVLAPVHKKHKPAFWMSAAASVAAVLFVGWMVLQQQAGGPAGDMAQPSLAQESVNSYLVAHQSTLAGNGMQAAYYVQPVAMSGNGN